MKRKILYLSTIAALLLTGCNKEKVNEAALEHLKPTTTISSEKTKHSDPTVAPTLVPLYIGEDAIDKVYPDMYSTKDSYDIRELTEKYVECGWNITTTSSIDQIKETLKECFSDKELLDEEIASLQEGINSGDTCELRSCDFKGAIVYQEDIYASVDVTFVVNGNEQKKSYAIPVGKIDKKWYITK